MNLNERERAIRQRLKADLEHYAAKCLKIRTKVGGVEPFLFNKAQRYLHRRLEEQRKRTGKVRAIILKGRQQGCSTYVSARYYHRVTHSKGLRVFILTHEAEATTNLFGMVERYHDNCPAAVRPTTGAANARELAFSLLDSGYKVGTAGSKGVGRSQTVQLFHGSEVAFWPHADTHAAGVMQAIADAPGTEVILESTANGLGNYFHQQWQAAEKGLGDYQAIFIPWFWQPEYSKPVPADFRETAEEEEYREAHGLDLGQIVWRRAKTAELKDEMLFKQEYPATAAEAFQTTGHDSFIPTALVLKARKAERDAAGPLVLGIDPARGGKDRFSIAWRQGRKVLKVESRETLDTLAGAGWARTVINADKPKRVFIDVGGVGAGVADLLVDWFGDDLVRLVNFGGEPLEPPRPEGGGPRNRRAEMWAASKDWLADVGGADLPDSDSLHADAVAPGYRYDSATRLLLESKEDMRRRGVRSPDEWDAVALTFAEPVSENSGFVKLAYNNRGII